MFDLIEILEERLSPSEVVELLNLYDKQKIQDYAIKHKICVKCLSDIIVVTWQEDRGEFWGSPAYENMSELRCSGCGEVFE